MLALTQASFLHRPGKPAIAYKRLAADPAKGGNLYPTLVFFTGFCSDMEGTKASFLAAACEERGQAMLRFDYSGHGLSEGAFMDGTIGTWFQDSLDVIDRLTKGPLLLVGSSMGGWIGLLSARARADRTAGLIGLAAAPDFTRTIPPIMNDAQKDMLARDGYFPLPGDDTERRRRVTRTLLEEGERHCILDAPLAISCPVRLVHGKQDADVPWPIAEKIADILTSQDKAVYLREEGNHSLSAPEDLALLAQLVAELS